MHAKTPVATQQWFAQQGEDFVAAVLLGEIDPDAGRDALRPPESARTFIEVGCIDGKRFSNTLAFEHAGWQGLCIEAHPDYIEPLRTNRPGSTVIHAAAGETDADSITFYANSRGTLSTLDRSLETQYKTEYGKYFTGFEQVEVPLRTISTMIDEAGIDRIDLLSIDVEGCDAAALRGVDLARHRPSVIVIEIDNDQDGKDIELQCVKAGYARVCSVSNNAFFMPAPEANDLLHKWQGRSFRVALTHTAHPLDDEIDRKQTHTVTPAF